MHCSRVAEPMVHDIHATEKVVRLFNAARKLKMKTSLVPNIQISVCVVTGGEPDTELERRDQSEFIITQ